MEGDIINLPVRYQTPNEPGAVSEYSQLIQAGIVQVSIEVEGEQESCKRVFMAAYSSDVALEPFVDSSAMSTLENEPRMSIIGANKAKSN